MRVWDGCLCTIPFAQVLMIEALQCGLIDDMAMLKMQRNGTWGKAGEVKGLPKPSKSSGSCEIGVRCYLTNSTKRLQELLLMAGISESFLNCWFCHVFKGNQRASTSMTVKRSGCFPFSNQGYQRVVFFGVWFFFFCEWSSSFRAPDTQTPLSVCCWETTHHISLQADKQTDRDRSTELKLNLQCQQ